MGRAWGRSKGEIVAFLADGFRFCELRLHAVPSIFASDYNLQREQPTIKGGEALAHFVPVQLAALGDFLHLLWLSRHKNEKSTVLRQGARVTDFLTESRNCGLNFRQIYWAKSGHDLLGGHCRRTTLRISGSAIRG